MAKPKKFSMDPFGSPDLTLDLPDFDFGDPGASIKDDRKPISKIGHGFKKGLRESATSSTFIRNAIKRTLPDGYGEAIDFGTSIYGAGRNLYNDAANASKPLINDARRAINKILPAAEKNLPKPVAEILRKFGASGSNYSPLSLTANDFRNSELERMQAEIFRYTADTDNKNRLQDEVKERIKDSIEAKRFKDSAMLLDQIRISTMQNTAFNTKVGAAYMRKSLELQYRQYYATVDILEETKKFSYLATEELKAITKNTGLPEYAKLTTGEYASQALRQKLTNALTGNVFQKRGQFLNNLSETVTKNLLGKVKSFTAAGREAGQVGSMMGGTGMDGMTEAGRFAGQQVGSSVFDALLGRYAAHGRNFLNKNKTIAKTGNRLSYLTNNAPQLLERFSRSRTDQYGIKGAGLDFLKDMLRGVGNPDQMVNVDKRGNLDEDAKYNRRTAKTINEIIPGYLSRIHQELKIMRTGDAKTERTTYDFDRNRFDSEGAVTKTTLGRLFDPVSRDNMSTSIERTLDRIDPNKTLSADQRKTLGRQLVRGNIEGSVGDKKTMTSRQFYKGDAAEHAGAYTNLFKKYYADDESGEKSGAFNSQYRNLGAGLDVTKGKIQDLIDGGQLSLLEDLGIVKLGKIDMATVYEYFAGRPITAESLQQVAAQSGKTGKMRSVRGRASADSTFSPSRTFNRTVNNISNTTSSEGHSSGLNSEEVVAAIKESNNRDVLEATRDALMRIEDRLANGTYMQGGLGGGAAIDKEGAQASVKTPWWKMPLYKAPVGLAKGVGRGASTAFSAYRGVSARMNRAVNKTLSGAFKGGKWGVEKLWQSGIFGATGRLAGRAGKAAFGGLKTADEVMNKARDQIYKTVPKVFGGIGSGVMGVVDAFRTPKDVYTKRKGFKTPTLFADIFKDNGYRSAKTGKPLARAAEIDGAVLDKDDNQVLTEEDLKDGLYGADGKKMKFGLNFAMNKLGNFAGKGIRNIFKGIATADGVIGAGVNFIKGLFGTFAGPGGIILTGGKTMVNRLTEIRDILDERLPKGKGKVFGDSDGDGVRDNSVADLNRKDKDKVKDKETQEDRKNNVGFGKMGGLGALGSLFGMFGKKKKPGGDDKEEEKGSGLGDAASNAASTGIGAYLASKIPGVGKIAKSAWGVGKSLLGGGKGFLGKGLGLASVAYGAKSGYDLVTGKSENKLMDGVSAGMGAWSLASLVGGGSALAGAGTIGSGLASLAGGIASLVSAPALIIGAAVAGLGYGAYKLYQYVSKKRLTPLSKIRVAQYGILPDDKDHADILFKFEDKLEKFVKYTGNTPTIELPKGYKAKELTEDFGIDDKNDGQMSKWIEWFMKRFKPVFITHLTALHAIDASKDLGDVENLKFEQKKKYMADSSFPDGPYGVDTSPFTDLKSLPVDGEGVSKLVAATQAQLDKDGDGGANGENKVDPNDVGLSAGLTLAGEGSGMKADEELKKKPGTTASGAAAAAAAAADAKFDTNMPAANPVAELNDMAASGSGLGFSATAGVDVDMYSPSNAQGRVDAITAIRYKTYGLMEMDTTKSRSLDSLEVFLGPKVKYDSDGKATWEGSIEDTLKAVGPSFGASPDTPNGYNWASWFKVRFLPTFLNWATILNKKTSRKNPVEAGGALRDQDRLDVAMAIITSKTSYGGAAVSVWTVPTSPWSGYTLNEDVKSTDDNIQGLRDLAKKLVSPEEAKNSSGLKKDDKDKAADAKALGAAGVGGKEQGFWSKILNGDDPNKPGGVTGLFKNMFGGTTGADVRSGKASGGTGTDASTTGGSEINHPGKGTGGDVNSLPKPTGNKSYAAVKELIEAAAKTVGVDPKLMTTMAAIESGFNWQVKAPTSSASGLYQFIDGTWKYMLNKYGAKYGIAPGTSQLDPRANALMGAEYIKENIGALTGAVDRPLTDTDLYLAHFMGPGGARQFLKADPKAIASSIFPQQARANANIFNEGGNALTIGQVYQKLNKLVKTKAAQFGMGGGGKDGSEPLVPGKNDVGGTGTSPGGAAASGGAVGESADKTVASGRQSPDMSPDGSGRASPMATSGGSTPKSTPDDAAKVMGSGFEMNSPKVQTAQAQYKKDSTDPALTADGSTQVLQQLTKIGMDQLDQLKIIAEALVNGGGANAAASNASASQGGSTPGQRQALGQGVGAPRAPISLAKSGR